MTLIQLMLIGNGVIFYSNIKTLYIRVYLRFTYDNLWWWGAINVIDINVVNTYKRINITIINFIK